LCAGVEIQNEVADLLIVRANDYSLFYIEEGISVAFRDLHDLKFSGMALCAPYLSSFLHFGIESVLWDFILEDIALRNSSNGSSTEPSNCHNGSIHATETDSMTNRSNL
jgi:hypothetical protein